MLSSTDCGTGLPAPPPLIRPLPPTWLPPPPWPPQLLPAHRRTLNHHPSASPPIQLPLPRRSPLQLRRPAVRLPPPRPPPLQPYLPPRLRLRPPPPLPPMWVSRRAALLLADARPRAAIGGRQPPRPRQMSRPQSPSLRPSTQEEFTLSRRLRQRTSWLLRLVVSHSRIDISPTARTVRHRARRAILLSCERFACSQASNGLLHVPAPPLAQHHV